MAHRWSSRREVEPGSVWIAAGPGKLLAVLCKDYGGKGGLWVAGGGEFGWRSLPAAAQSSPGGGAERGGARVRVRGCWGSRGATYRAAGNLGMRAKDAAQRGDHGRKVGVRWRSGGERGR